MALASGRAGEAPPTSSESCTSDPNFAVICAFIHEFGSVCGVDCPPLGKLQVWN
jgi:hypothetical protein